ncbi:hypothetical protein ACVW0J_009676 [Bradyrhizobium sp. i1.7.7]
MPALLHWLAVSLFGRSQHHSSIPGKLPAIGTRRGSVALPQGRPGRALSLAAARTLLSGAAACSLGILMTFAAPSAGRAEAGSRAQAARSSNPLPGLAYAASVAEASHRFAIPERWIRAVRQAESGGNAHAISPRGALGLMQSMPATWLELSVRHDLGIDPFDPHDNIMAGAAYLREMLDRFGSAGFLAAYNAGPKRYEEHLATGRALPDETRIYIARLASLIGIEQRNSGGSGARRFATWQQAPILVEGSESLFPDGNSASGVRTMNSSKAAPNAATTALVPRATGPFVRRSDGTKTAVSNPSVAFLRRRGWNRWSSTNAARDCSTTHKAICLHRRRANDDGGSCRAQGQARRARHGAGARLSLFAGAAWRERGFVRCQAHQSYR